MIGTRRYGNIKSLKSGIFHVAINRCSCAIVNFICSSNSLFILHVYVNYANCQLCQRPNKHGRLQICDLKQLRTDQKLYPCYFYVAHTILTIIYPPSRCIRKHGSFLLYAYKNFGHTVSFKAKKSSTACVNTCIIIFNK